MKEVSHEALIGYTGLLGNAGNVSLAHCSRWVISRQITGSIRTSLLNTVSVVNWKILIRLAEAFEGHQIYNFLISMTLVLLFFIILAI